RLQFDVKGNLMWPNLKRVWVSRASFEGFKEEVERRGLKRRWSSSKRKPRPPLNKNTYQSEYVVERIEDCDIMEGILHFYVKWENWPSANNTWEPKEHLEHSDKILEQFLDKTLTVNIIEELRIKLNVSKVGFQKVFNMYPSYNFENLPSKIHLQQELLSLHLRFPYDHHVVKLEKGRQSWLLFDLVMKRQEQLTELKAWEDRVNSESIEETVLKVENNVDMEVLPKDFVYINDNVPRKNVRILKNVISGCECTECGPKIKACCGRQDYNGFTYKKGRRINVNPGTAVFECNHLCKCDANCRNRVVQAGRKVPLCIFRTHNGRGWGVKTLRKVHCGEFICEYVGEVITHEEAEIRGREYDAQGRTYLFDLDYNTKDNPYTVDAAKFGNVSHFINHSCDPNCAVWAVWINTLDPNLPRLAIFSLREIEKDEELTFDYMCTPESPVNTPEKNRPKLETPEKNSGIKSGKSLCKCSADKCRRYLF
ncbi:hypothetical protein HHI36_012037, partial [Cryptolaemus montrouzieri]